MKDDIMGTRMIVNAWNASEVTLTALPPCHTFFQIIGIPGKGFELHWHQRSVDLFLGLPFNIASYATLGSYLEVITGHKFLALQGDLKAVHFYDNQFAAAKEIVTRSVSDLNKCSLQIKTNTENFEDVNISDFELIGYNSHEAMNVKMLAPLKI
jgi:thymidylate synthase